MVEELELLLLRHVSGRWNRTLGRRYREDALRWGGPRTQSYYAVEEVNVEGTETTQSSHRQLL